MPCPELITLEMMRLMDSATPEWERWFKRYDQLLDAGLPTDEAARIVCDLSRRTHEHELERTAA